MSTATLDDINVSYEEITRAIGRLEGQVKSGFDEVRKGQDALLAEQRETNGKVRELREWREGHRAETIQDRQAIAGLTVHVEKLMDLEKLRIAAKADADAKQNRRLATWAIFAALLGGATVQLFEWAWSALRALLKQ